MRKRTVEGGGMAVLTLPNAEVAPPTFRAQALVFADPLSRMLEADVRRIAPSEATVLVNGETGTGKEIVARHLHALSRRRDRPFVAVNCGAFTESLVESELFGHEKGAFTGAAGAKAGWFEVADGGTLFLDEIGELPPTIQVKLLRVLQEREVVRLGSRQPTRFDVRLIAATHVDLGEAVAAGRFREDLFYRLNVATLSVRPLRERPGDIVPLAEHFLGVYARQLDSGPALLTPAAAERLAEHDWPGNIRELENVIHHALVLCHGNRVTPEELRFPTRPKRPTAASGASSNGSALKAALTALFEENGPKLHDRIEETVFRAAYGYCDHNQVQTARLLGISRNVVRARLIQFGDLTESPRASRPTAPVGGSGARLRIVGAGKVRIGYQKFGLLGAVKASGALDAALRARAVDLEWIEFPGGTQLVDAMRERRIDLGVVGEGPPVLGQAARTPIVYLAAEPPAPEAEAIIVPRDSPIRSVAELKGKTIALNKGANVNYLILRALEEAGLRSDDVSFSFVAPTGARAAFDSREVDAWAIWSPLLDAVVRDTGARVVRDGRGLCTNVAFYIGTRDFVDGQAELVRLFLDEVRAVGTLRPMDAALVASQQEVADTFLRARVISRSVSAADALSSAIAWG
jgi:DNA-binding NtrC family response regulator/ABC-type nitrate/sulfonate/bicarbonate transport system substrate-binding protein